MHNNNLNSFDKFPTFFGLLTKVLVTLIFFQLRNIVVSLVDRYKGITEFYIKSVFCINVFRFVQSL